MGVPQIMQDWSFIVVNQPFLITIVGYRFLYVVGKPLKIIQIMTIPEVTQGPVTRSLHYEWCLHYELWFLNSWGCTPSYHLDIYV